MYKQFFVSFVSFVSFVVAPLFVSSAAAVH